MNDLEAKLMNAAIRKTEVAILLAKVVNRMILPPQNVPHSDQDCLDVMPNTSLNVSTKPVNGDGEPGD